MTAPVTESQLFRDLAIVLIYLFFYGNNFFLTNPNNFNFLSVYSAFSGPQLRITIVYNKGYHFG